MKKSIGNLVINAKNLHQINWRKLFQRKSKFFEENPLGFSKTIFILKTTHFEYDLVTFFFGQSRQANLSNY